MKWIAIFVLMVISFWLGNKAHQYESEKAPPTPPNCAAERLTGEQVAYVKYKQALSKWAYENGTQIDYEAIDSLYYFPK